MNFIRFKVIQLKHYLKLVINVKFNLTDHYWFHYLGKIHENHVNWIIWVLYYILLYFKYLTLKHTLSHDKEPGLVKIWTVVKCLFYYLILAHQVYLHDITQ